MFGENDIAFEIRKLHQLIKREFEKDVSLRKDRPTKIQAAVITFISRAQLCGKDVYQKDIEKEFSIRASTATILLRNMESNGRITKISSKADARLKKIVLTQKSQTLLKEIKEKANAIKEKITRGLDDKDISNFVTFLHKLQNNLEDNNVKNII